MHLATKRKLVLYLTPLFVACVRLEWDIKGVQESQYVPLRWGSCRMVFGAFGLLVFVLVRDSDDGVGHSPRE